METSNIEIESEQSIIPDMAAEVKLKYALAYKGKEQLLYRNTNDLVFAAISMGTGLYPINELPSARKPQVDKLILTTSESVFDAEINGYEAMGLVAVGLECQALWEMFRSVDKNHGLRRILKLDDNQWPSDFIRGMAMFDENAETTSGARKWIKEAVQIDNDQPINFARKHYVDIYRASLEKDGLIIGKHTTRTMVKEVVKFVKEHEPFSSNEVESATIKVRRLGANAARKLYLEVYKAASKEFKL